MKARFALALLLCSCCYSALALQQDDPFAELDNWEAETEQTLFDVFGFVEVAYGQRISTDPVVGRPVTLSDVRGQIKWQTQGLGGQVSTSTDLYYDGVKGNVELQFRELAWQGNLGALGEIGRHFDLKVGQQVLTWGVGDFVFLNDLFPKDFQSFFSGRDDEYLKFPSASIKLSGYTKAVSADIVFTPRFAPDNFLNGEYFSFFNPLTSENVAPDFVVADENRPESAEWAGRVYTEVNGTEFALYGYDGFHKSPNSFDALGRPAFSKLQVWGASAVTPLAGGLVKAEYAYYDSLDDKAGINPLVPNSQSRYLLGFEREIVSNLTGSVQWYLEHQQHYSELITRSLAPEFEGNENRQVWTTRLTYQGFRQTLILTAFNFYSPSDDDGYARLSLTYRPVDKWSISVGANGFYGEQPQTFFSQLKDGSNVYARFRLNY